MNSARKPSYIMAADIVAQKNRLRIESCDHRAINNSISNRMLASKKLKNELGDALVVLVDAVMTEQKRPEGTNKRKGRRGRKKNGDDHLPSNTIQTQCHRCHGYLAYQNVCKTYATEGTKHIIVDFRYVNMAANGI